MKFLVRGAKFEPGSERNNTRFYRELTVADKLSAKLEFKICIN